MSLTQFVSEPLVREKIDEAFPNQGPRASNSLQAEWKTNNYMIVGTAFDYLARFWMRRTASEYHSRPWIAEHSLEVAREKFSTHVAEIEEVIERAKDARDEYLKSGEASEVLIKSALDLARIDGVFRGDGPPVNLGKYDEDDIEDCKALLEILEDSQALEGDVVDLNPAFGLVASIVGGADADMIVDGTLVDLKTTTQATFKVDYWRQLVGYLILVDIHDDLCQMGLYDSVGLADDPSCRPLPDIDDFGVYYARHGELSTSPAEAIYGAENYAEFKSWFVDKGFGLYPSSDEAIENTIKSVV